MDPQNRQVLANWRLSVHDVAMLQALLATLCAILRTRTDLMLENLALRQQLSVFKHKSPRPRLNGACRLFWVALSSFWPKWKQALALVQPQTVIRWHRLGFRAYWRWKSNRRPLGRPRIDAELQEIIRRMVRENPTWGAPRIHGELLLLGFKVAERTVSRYLRGRPSNPDAVQNWKRFLELHRKALVGMDFFTVPTINFQVLYVLVLVDHHRRQVLYWAVTKAPTADWIRQQLRQAFPYDTAPKYLILDRDALFGLSVLTTIRNLGTKPKRIGRGKPWQNGVCERWVGSVRRELLDHVVIFHEAHLRRLLKEYVACYHEDRSHLALDKDTPAGREVERPPEVGAKIVSFPRIGGLHHRYGWKAAA